MGETVGIKGESNLDLFRTVVLKSVSAVAQNESEASLLGVFVCHYTVQIRVMRCCPVVFTEPVLHDKTIFYIENSSQRSEVLLSHLRYKKWV